MRKSLIWLLSVAVPVSAAHAAGYGLHEQSAEAMGAAYAGAAAGGSDASYIVYNPASVSVKEGGEFAFGTTLIMPSASATVSNALTSAGTPIAGDKAPSDFIRTAVLPNVAWRGRIADGWSAGLSVSVPWGLSTNYSTTYPGRYYGLNTKLTTVNITPMLAYDIAPGVSVGGGMQLQYAKGLLNNAVDIGTLGALNGIKGAVPGGFDGSATVRAAGWGYGFTLGARAELDDGWTLGLSYRSQVHHTLRGPFTFNLDSAGLGAAIGAATGLFKNTTASAKMATPDVLEFGARKQLGGGWTLMAEASRTGWSAFRQLTVVAANPAQPNDVTNAQWNDAWMGSLGVEYAADDDWTWRAGTSYDATPIPTANLTPRIPDTSRTWLALGATYHMNPAADLKFSAAHLFNADRTMALNPAGTGNALRGTLVATTRSAINVLGFEVAYRWP
jgi:long-chain fatty acid transport protein